MIPLLRAVALLRSVINVNYSPAIPSRGAGALPRSEEKLLAVSFNEELSSFQSRAGVRMNLDQDERPGRGGSAFPLPAVLPPGCPGGTEGMERAGAAGSVRAGGQERD